MWDNITTKKSAPTPLTVVPQEPAHDGTEAGTGTATRRITSSTLSRKLHRPPDHDGDTTARLPAPPDRVVGPVPKVNGVYSIYPRGADLFLHSEQEPGPTHGHIMDRHEDIRNVIVQHSIATHVLRCKVLHIEATGLLDFQTPLIPFVRSQVYCWLDKKDTMEPTPNPMGNLAGAAKVLQRGLRTWADNRVAALLMLSYYKRSQPPATDGGFTAWMGRDADRHIEAWFKGKGACTGHDRNSVMGCRKEE
ncbi:hypothetical protein NPX13_g9495 [Xylaria arbuscula]|uniref:Uncharacterized protein n=1 Tax=Xylaria arbuscula TaxID=114810 RepID=A0A9W8N6H0_9PEZI|nr:hypothetical protein NPX13_g9495 [Xylaria arbuscula]